MTHVENELRVSLHRTENTRLKISTPSVGDQSREICCRPTAEELSPHIEETRPFARNFHLVA